MTDTKWLSEDERAIFARNAKTGLTDIHADCMFLCDRLAAERRKVAELVEEVERLKSLAGQDKHTRWGTVRSRSMAEDYLAAQTAVQELVEALNKISIESDCDDIIKIATDALAKNGGKP